MDNIRKFIEADLKYLLNLLEQIVNINSFSHNSLGINAVLDVLVPEYNLLNLNIERLAEQGYGDILILKTCHAQIADRSVLLIGHADTVHLPDSTFRQFKTSKDCATGPGVLDMKGGLVLMLGVLRALNHIGRLHDLPLTILINSDEEIGSPFSSPTIEKLCEYASQALVFEWGRKADALITRRKGILKGQIQIQGRAAHAGNAIADGVNALVEAAHVTLQLNSLNNPAAGISCNIGRLQGGTVTNVVPDHAQIYFEVRAENSKDLDRAAQQVKIICSKATLNSAQIQVSNLRLVRPMEKSPEVNRLLNILIEAGHRNGLTFHEAPKIFGGASNANNTAAVGVPTIDGLGPNGDGAHTDEEYIEISSFVPRITAVADYLLSLK